MTDISVSADVRFSMPKIRCERGFRAGPPFCVAMEVLETDRIENQVVMDVIPVYVGGEDKLIFSPQDLPRQLHADPVGFLRRDLPRLKRLDEVPAQVRALVDGMAAGPGKFDVGGLGGAAEGGHQQLPVRLVGIADIVNGRFQR